jgi:hypothetical protein|tara:strand:- start:512 stop:1207 length:696 start_codon:yes stop_codon:yes gene_type:complete
MKFETTEHFPTFFYEFTWTEDQIRPLKEEVEHKSPSIKWIYENQYAPDPRDRVEEYWTDHSKAVELHGYSKLVDEVVALFLPKFKIVHQAHWTAISGPKGYHECHQHSQSNPFETMGPNMSSILYLSNIGKTHVFNPNQQGSIDPEIFIESVLGKMVMFPSHILHRALPHMVENEERFIISSNWSIGEAYPGSFWEQEEITPGVKIPVHAKSALAAVDRQFEFNKIWKNKN